MRKLFLIAGHNGKGTGASGVLDEGSETIVLRDLLDEEMCKYNIVAEVDENGKKLNDVVVKLKKEVKPTDICIDIHFNASTNEKATGVECLISASGSIEKALAYDLCSTTAKVLGIKNRGVKGESSGAHSKLAMLSSFKCEQMIYEVCFCTNASDVKAYKEKKQELVKAIGQIIVKYVRL